MTRILVIDDEESQRDVMKRYLTKLGYSVEVSDSSENALEILKKEFFPLIITDLNMPKMNGVETIREIQKLDKSIKVMLSSGHLERDMVIPDGLKPDGNLPKPYRMRELAKKLREVLA